MLINFILGGHLRDQQEKTKIIKVKITNKVKTHINKAKMLIWVTYKIIQEIVKDSLRKIQYSKVNLFHCFSKNMTNKS